MSSQPSLPSALIHPTLAEVARELDLTRAAALLCDDSWQLVWASTELKALLGEEDEGKLGYGRHLFECYLSDTWRSRTTEESQVRGFLEVGPYILFESPQAREHVLELFGQDMRPLLDAMDLRTPPEVFSSSFDFVRGDLPPTPINYFVARIRDDGGRVVGRLFFYTPDLPARVLDLVSRGDEGMFERMLRLFDPGRRRAAILFADLQASATLSRRLPSAAYFKLICAITTAIDEVVIHHQGIVGKHAGDGVTAFFLAEDLGSSSGAARAAIAAAHSIAAAAGRAALEVGAEHGSIEPADCAVNVGVHWGGRLYMGQLVTGGRLEVTALGDEVNECARIQQSARGGQALGSKALIEHLTYDDAHAVGVDPDQALYTTLAELEGAPPKAVRDAGGVAVSVL
ncbi:MAG: hypothetical protein M3345_00150 [Actinomycetota bacterium]|nr:hypothetical protein [Actinomycetota bacterium]